MNSHISNNMVCLCLINNLTLINIVIWICRKILNMRITMVVYDQNYLKQNLVNICV